MRHRKDRSAGVIVFHRTADGCRFLLLRSRQTRRPLWEFPKGGVQPGESLKQAALRELREETGLGEADVRLVDGFERNERYRFVTTDEGQRYTIVKRVTYFLAEANRVDVTIAPVESTRYDWFATRDARRRVRYAARRAMLEAAAKLVRCAAADSAPPSPVEDQSETSSRTRDASTPGGNERA
ncbi:MAG: NUDIX domain-containing protein [Gemmatimonadetes bacterium]|nr:NUDIX domain-containing protein [Gemmatimonadota bacterium]